MSKYVEYYNTYKEVYRNVAKRLVKVAEENEFLKLNSVAFRPIGVRFGLIKEFKKMGIL